MVAVVVSQQFVTAPHLRSEDAEESSGDRAPTFQKGLSLPLPEVPKDEQSIAPGANEATPMAEVATAPGVSARDRDPAGAARVGVSGVALSASVLMIDEGASGTYTARLESRPEGAVTVRPSSDDAGVFVSPSSLHFDAANWDIPQTVTVRTAEDDDAVDDTATLAHAVTGYGDQTEGGVVVVTVLDAPEQQVSKQGAR